MSSTITILGSSIVEDGLEMQKDIADNFKQRQVLSFSYPYTLQFTFFYTPRIYGLCQGLHPYKVEWKVLHHSRFSSNYMHL